MNDPLPNDEQRKLLSDLMARAFVMIRDVGFAGFVVRIDEIRASV